MRPLGTLCDSAIALLQEYQPKDQPYHGAFSGGKDSVVIKALAKMAEVNVVWHYNVTTIDPPELVKFIKREHRDVLWSYSTDAKGMRRGNFFHRMEKKGFPTRLARWCCAEYKEQSAPKGATMILGVRAAESPRRAKTWKHVTMHTRTKSWALAPILDWTDEEVWSFIKRTGTPYCSLYDEGFKRLGCVGCPMARERGRRAEFKRWPRFEKLWRRSFHHIWQRRVGTLQRNGKVWFGEAFFKNPDDMFEWWLSDAGSPAHPRRMTPLAERPAEEAPHDEDAEEDSCQRALDQWSAADGDEDL